MIGLKLKNSVWEKALSSLLEGRAEIWQENKSYSVILTDLKNKELKIFQKKARSPLIGLNNNLKNTISLPCTKVQLENALTILKPYENKNFIWNPVHRQLKNKYSKKIIPLTEKEAHVINFLISCPQMKASKNELLKNVWQYTHSTETHTVETTIYALNQKTRKGIHKLITSTPNGYRLN